MQLHSHVNWIPQHGTSCTVGVGNDLQVWVLAIEWVVLESQFGIVSQAEGQVLACYSMFHRSPDLNGLFEMAYAMENRCEILDMQCQ